MTRVLILTGTEIWNIRKNKKISLHELKILLRQVIIDKVLTMALVFKGEDLKSLILKEVRPSLILKYFTDDR